MTPEVVHLDNHLLVVAKPPGMLSQADDTGDLDVIAWAKAFLKREFDKPGNVFAGLVHRLDRPVGGVMVIARTSKAASRLADQFRRRTPEKRYLAMVEGRLTDEGRAEDWLLKTHDKKRGTRVKRVREGTPGAKRAALAWTTRSIVGERSLVEVRLETGRAHQIRVQLAGLGHPIVGDLRYGASGALSDGRSLALHATHLTIEHPTQRDRQTFTSPPPNTWGGAFSDAVRRVMRDS
ncbi:MAG: RNA pseudouridine synthase [Bacteroidota bacterium]